ncbi:hypothetical protein EFK50_16565 [Nocardioides marmoriginsengisoli]|uniref:Uncharacterized protein n=1 Tax=Nocardioides marmoriginsengisoli TaxID=661483 RepID=A0A3N0CC31_9ACTN|nr:hypothetical protein [Nocardioides marmoriginsengisoli]RNL61000.1 hypothetical protein EFK50_16565 [Nocardioides marmoriginsengisoli]
MSTNPPRPGPSPAPQPERVFRLHVADATSSNCSGSRTTFYTNLVDLRSAVLRAHLDILEHERTSRNADDGGERDLQSRAAGRWRRLFRLDRGEDPAASYPRVTKILVVQQFHDGAWHDLTPVFTEPNVHLDGVR